MMKDILTRFAKLNRAGNNIFYHNKRYPQEMGAGEVQSFLSYLAVKLRVSASTQNQALNALVFLYKHVLKKELGAIDAVRAR